LFVASGPIAKGGPVTYTYTGETFTTIPVASPGFPVTTSDFITASFTFASALPDSLPYNDPDKNAGDVILDWTISDQNTTLSSGAGNFLEQAAFDTDASGNIDDWNFEADGNFECLLTVSCWNMESYYLSAALTGYSNSGLDQSVFFAAGVDSTTVIIENRNDPGTWSVTSTTPEPTTFWIAGAALAIACFVGARKPKHVSLGGISRASRVITPAQPFGAGDRRFRRRVRTYPIRERGLFRSADSLFKGQANETLIGNACAGGASAYSVVKLTGQTQVD
jgi:hypothetical protein